MIAPTVLGDAAIYQENGQIVEVGAYVALAAKYQPDEILGSDRHVARFYDGWLEGLVSNE